jgi:hypothetical protein
LNPEDQDEPSGPDRWIWLLMGVAKIFALAGVIGSLARLFGVSG